MNRSTRLDQIAALNGGFENMAGARLGAAQARYEQSRHQLEQLLLYREEYHQRLDDRVQAPVSAREMRDYRFFFDSLEEAIRQQQATVEAHDRERELARAEWLRKRQDVKKVAQAAENLRRREDAVLARREQQEVDECNQFRAPRGALLDGGRL